MESMIKVKAFFDNKESNEQIEAHGRDYAIEYGVPLVRYSIRQMAGYKEALFCLSSQEPSI